MAKVLQINATYGLGSTGVIVSDLKRCCEQNNVICDVICCHQNGGDNHVHRVGNVLTNKLHALLSRIDGKSAYYSFLTTLNIIRLVKSISPNIIQLHNLHSNFVNLNMLLRYLATTDIKIIVTLHDSWYYTGGCTHYASIKCNKWKTDCADCPQPPTITKSLLANKTTKILSDRKRYFKAIKDLTIVGVSQWITNEAKQNIFNSRNCICIHNGIDTHFYEPQKSMLKDQYKVGGRPLILVLANKWNLDENKEARIELLKAFSEKCSFVFIGSSFVCDLREQDINLGFIANKEQLRDIFSASDVFINLSHEDTLPTINMEAQACGLPVIGYHVTGVPETIVPGVGGVVEEGNTKDLIAITMRCLSNLNQEDRLKCREFVCNNYNREKNYQKYIELYNLLLNE